MTRSAGLTRSAPDAAGPERVDGGAGDLSIEAVSKRYEDQSGPPALDKIDLNVSRGEMVVLLGPSGCGKSTLLRSIAGLETIDSGRIKIGDNMVSDPARSGHVPAHKRDIGLVFQSYSLWPHKTVLENVVFPLQARRLMSRQQRAARGREMLELVQCEQFADRFPAALSGGQQQRVALARALASRPAVLLLDEPLSNLDSLLRRDLRSYLRELHNQVHFTGIYVTHDQVEALNIADKVAVVHSGSVLQEGTPQEVYRAPATPFVAKFLGAHNSLEVIAHDAGRCVTPWGPMRPVGDVPDLPVGTTIMFRPDECTVYDEGARSSAPGWVLGASRLVHSLFGGEASEAVLERDGQRLTVRGSALRFRDPNQIILFVPMRAAHVFPPDVATNGVPENVG